MGLGFRIKTLRKRAGITQPELAEKLGVHETTIRRWEQEKDRGPDGKTVAQIASILNTTSEYLLSETETTTGRDIELNDKAGHLVFRDGNRIVDLPDTPENKKLYWQVVEKILNAPVAIKA